jgi:hypothetical protein
MKDYRYDSIEIAEYIGSLRAYAAVLHNTVSYDMLEMMLRIRDAEQRRLAGRKGF